MKLSENHQVIMPYLILKDARRFIDFVKVVFDAKVSVLKMRDDHHGKIMHAELQINGSTIMCADITADWAPVNAGLFVYVDNADQTYQKAVDNGAGTVMPLSDQDYGRTCGVVDIQGNTWWITSINHL